LISAGTKVIVKITSGIPHPDVSTALTIQVVELELLATPAPHGSNVRPTTWISRGMKIQEAQASLGRDVKKMGSRSTDIQRLAVAHRADRLMGKIATFVSEASAYLEGPIQMRPHRTPSHPMMAWKMRMMSKTPGNTDQSKPRFRHPPVSERLGARRLELRNSFSRSSGCTPVKPMALCMKSELRWPTKLSYSGPMFATL
jgi:hypothetical protein